MTQTRPTQREWFLSTEVATNAQLMGLDCSLYERVYLGNPFCLLFKANLLSDPDGLARAIRHVRSSGASPIVSLIAMPSRKELDILDNLIEAGRAAGVDGFEVHSAGVLYHLSRKPQANGCLTVVGGFANVYTHRTAKLFAEMSAGLIMPNYELPLQAVNSIASAVSIPLEMLVHGKIPLGLSESCLLVERQTQLNTKCPDSCAAPAWLEFDRWSLRSLGKLTCSGKDICLLPQLPELWSQGYRHFRISGLCEDATALNQIGRVYRMALDDVKNGRIPNNAVLEELRPLSKYGFCNGYLFGKSGCEWVEER